LRGRIIDFQADRVGGGHTHEGVPSAGRVDPACTEFPGDAGI